ncbi:hypothetical protein [Wolbachia endosymbiont of Brugia malayi]|uniref:hypothetical protein n=1 Tax=Wolbachia endosymbiont of Brugia malayi TaxID=80849 RepID=UPI00030EF4F8|nr:hypothetical protein [Wolbachia endosymbiont of Brugia malayi]
MINSFDADLEHLLPHQLNDGIHYNINKLRSKYGNKVSEDVINDGEFKQLVKYINDSY